MRSRTFGFILFSALCAIVSWYLIHTLFGDTIFWHTQHSTGDILDSLHGVPVYYGTPGGRHLAEDGYNFGLRWQCVEFVKRYYYHHLGHSMPDTWGNAVDFFDSSLNNASLNERRGLLQFKNGNAFKPQEDDILVYRGTRANPYGHVSIVVSVTDEEMEMIQQNLNTEGTTRTKCSLDSTDKGWFAGNYLIMGWLRLPSRHYSPPLP